MNKEEWNKLLESRVNQLSDQKEGKPMPAKSKKQQKLFGMVKAAQEGKVKGASSKVKKIAKTMGTGAVDAFAGTKHKGLPEAVKKTRRAKPETMASFMKKRNKKG